MNVSITPPIERASKFSDYLQWLQCEALPRWSTRGLTKPGASIEQFLYNGKIDSDVDLRMRVQWRQLVVFSLAHSNSWISDGVGCIERVEGFLNNCARPKLNGSGGDTFAFAHKVDSYGQVVDGKQDLYDFAFQLLSYACRHQALGSSVYLHEAKLLMGIIDRNFASNHGGWLEGNYEVIRRRQNPHMHLFEAFLMLYESSKDEYWLNRASVVFDLFVNYFYQSNSFVLFEYFNHDWSLPDSQFRVVEPGHMMEWVWLLRKYQSLSGIDVEQYCGRLYHRAIELGRSKNDLMWDETSVDGVVLEPTHRCWPLTEWIKASLAQASEADDRAAYDYVDDALSALGSLQTYYLSHPVSGQYIDQLDSDLECVNNNAPASSLYHLMMCGVEVDQYLTRQGTK